MLSCLARWYVKGIWRTYVCYWAILVLFVDAGFSSEWKQTTTSRWTQQKETAAWILLTLCPYHVTCVVVPRQTHMFTQSQSCLVLEQSWSYPWNMAALSHPNALFSLKFFLPSLFCCLWDWVDLLDQAGPERILWELTSTITLWM